MESSRRSIAESLAAAALIGELDRPAVTGALKDVLGERRRWQSSLAGRIAEAFAGRRPSTNELAAFILGDSGFERACQRYTLRIARRLLPPPGMHPSGPAAAWRLPPLRTTRELADWLGLPAAHLPWLADTRSFESKRSTPALRNYRYRVMRKPSGGVRIVEAPKPRLRAVQRQLLRGLLDAIPPADAAHGFRKGRSVATFAAPHAGRAVVMKIDLEDFFPSVGVARVRALLRAAGYPEAVAELLAGLTSNTAPPEVVAQALSHCRDRSARWRAERYRQPHLPQGAPTSPAIANLCAYRLDRRLTALADAAGAVYTRYADDLAFSGGGGFARGAERFATRVHAVTLEEGFRVNFRKTRVMRPAGSQRLVGLVVNGAPAAPRRERDILRATLTNCIRHGPEGQNRSGHADFRGHLSGRVAYVEMIHAGHGARLRKLLEQIRWAPATT